MYTPAASPTWAVVMVMPLPAVVNVLPTAPTMVTSSPSRIQTVPRPIRTIQCHLDHGNRSRRPGTVVSVVLRSGSRSTATLAVTYLHLPLLIGARLCRPVAANSPLLFSSARYLHSHTPEGPADKRTAGAEVGHRGTIGRPTGLETSEGRRCGIGGDGVSPEHRMGRGNHRAFDPWVERAQVFTNKERTDPCY